MATGNVVWRVALLAAAAAAAAPATADEAGCAALAERVKVGVAALARDRGLAAAHATSGSAPRVADAIGGPHTCSATAAIASRAFNDALRGLNLRLAWNDDWLRPGDYCQSHYLEQCYPRHDRFAPLPPPSDFAFVARAWQSVTRALASQMPYGTGGDLSSFTDASLESALASEFRATFGEARRASLSAAAGPRGTQLR